LTVVDPCTSTTITASSLLDRTILAYDSVLTINFDSFTYVDFMSQTTLCGAFTYSVTYTLGTATTALSTLSYSSASQYINIQSLSLSQVGTINVNLVGALSSYSTQSATRTFVVTVLNPCW
jgi:hypothetical protein